MAFNRRLLVTSCCGPKRRPCQCRHLCLLPLVILLVCVTWIIFTEVWTTRKNTELRRKHPLWDALGRLPPPRNMSSFSLPVLVEPFVSNLDKIRMALMKPEKHHENLPMIKPPFSIIDARESGYFEKVKHLQNVQSVKLEGTMNEAQSILFAPNIFHYGAPGEKACSLMTSKKHAIYYSGKELLNRTCCPSIDLALKPSALDITLLRIGLPDNTTMTSQKTILTYMDVVSDALLLDNGRVITQGDVVIQSQRCVPYDNSVHLPKHPEWVPHYDEVFSLTEQTQVWYYHSTIEDLPRLAPYLSFLLSHPEIRIHTTPSVFHITMLEFLGISRHRLVSGDVIGKIVYLPAGTACGRPSVFPTQLLSNLFHQRIVSIQKRENPRDYIVLIHRADPERNFYNHKSILADLRVIANTHNLEVIVFVDDPSPSLEFTVKTFNRARVIVAPHGAGLSNMIFSRPGTLVVEGLCRLGPPLVWCWWGYLPWVCRDVPLFTLSFRNLATVLGHLYYGITPGESKKSCLYATADQISPVVEKFLKKMPETNFKS